MAAGPRDSLVASLQAKVQKQTDEIKRLHRMLDQLRIDKKELAFDLRKCRVHIEQLTEAQRSAR